MSTAHFTPLRVVADRLGLRYEWLRSQLHDGGQFHGIGHRKGRHWVLTASDIDAILARMSVPTAAEPHTVRDMRSGLSARSRRRSA